MSRETLTANTFAEPAEEQDRLAEAADDTELTAAQAAYECFREYSREHPGVVALWCLGVGFVLGWKLKPW